MKIGILTIQSAYNYGALLQAYALEHFLSLNGYETEIIDYRPNALNDRRMSKLWFKLSHPRFLIAYLKDSWSNPKKFQAFEKFMDIDLKKSKNVYTRLNDKLENDYDIFIAGSDQIWNNKITNDDANFLLEFIYNDKIKCSYASSFGLDILEPRWEEVVKTNLETFDFISVREKKGKTILENLLFNKKIEVVLDPTFLLSSEEWKLIEKPVKQLENEKYVLLYQLEENEKLLQDTLTIAQKDNLKIVSIHPMFNVNKYADFNLGNIEPKEFVWLIAHATYVCTNSYHGMIFSIIYNKSVNVYPHSQTGSRMVEVLEKLDLQKDEVYTDIKFYKTTEFAIKQKDELVDHSKKYLQSCLNSGCEFSKKGVK